MKKIKIVLFLFLISIISIYLFFKEGSLAVNKKTDSSKIFVIESGQPLQTIINNLYKEGFIRNKIVFYLIIKQKGIERTIQAGDFNLSSSMNAYQIADNLTHGTLDVWVTLIEGTRIEEMAPIISKVLNISEIDFIKQAKEGYMFPDTYLFPKGATAKTVIEIMIKNFNNKYSTDLKQQISRQGLLSPDEALILASIVEKEARTEKDRNIVANILIKRIKEDWPLQVDATIQYALGYQVNEKTWWKKYLSEDDLKIESPYNSYENKGLPPTPICNPGLTSLLAVVNADGNTPYWYYMSDLTHGKMYYGKTLEEHERNIELYLK